MNKILVVFTGGTIGSRIHNSMIDVDNQTGFELINKLQDIYHYAIEFDTIQPLNILSENSTPSHWKIIYDTINQIDFNKYKGVIITHGSDTLSYTSAAMGILLHYTPIPILITASNYALENDKSNGLVNVKSCVDFIVNSAMPGVFTIYQDDKGKNIVYLATRIMEAEPYNDQYFGFGGVEFGEIKEGIFKPLSNRINPKLGDFTEQRSRLIIKDITFKNEVLAIRPYPGLNYDFISLKIKPKAILHSLYHSATGCTGDSRYSLCKFAKRCLEEGIDLYLISFKDLNIDLYKTSREILESGAVPLQNISFESAYTKLCIAYNQTEMAPREYIEKELFYEFLPR